MLALLVQDGIADRFAAPDFLARVRNRDEQALQELVRAYLPQLFRTARGAGLNSQNAEDVTQNTFLTFIQKIDAFEGRSHLRTWLFGILYRKISEMRRAAGREGRSEDIDDVVEARFKSDGHWMRPPRKTDAAAYDTEVRKHLGDCLEGVTADQRMAFVLREVEEMESTEICETLGVSRSNLGVLLYRCRNLLRECLESKNIKG